MQVSWTFPVLIGILIIGFAGFSQVAFADSLTLFHTTFVDSFSVAAQEQLPLGLAFSSDGTKMFVVGIDGDAVNGYTLTTPFDVSTASFVDSVSVEDEETNPRGIAFSSDGTKMFVVGLSEDNVNEYTLPTPFSLFQVNFVDSFSVAAQETLPTDIAFSPDGTKMFVVGTAGDAVNEYNITLIGTCSPPPSGDWTVSSNCTMTGDSTAAGNVIVPNGVVLTIPNGVTLDINFATKNLTVQAGGGVLIKAGGAIT